MNPLSKISEQFRFDPEELLKDELVLNKMDVAERQLITAIKMFFFEWDAVSLHTVTSAAHGVLRDLALNAGITKSFKDSPLIADGNRGKYIDAVHLPQNFFKHAKSDPRGRMVFHYNGTPLLILDALLLFVSLKGNLSNEMRVFLVWTQLRFPDLLCLDAVGDELALIRQTTRDPDSFKVLGRVLLSNAAEPR